MNNFSILDDKDFVPNMADVADGVIILALLSVIIGLVLALVL